jgi:tripartite-type tricarboxylate transporter receptor subunit TctC
MKKVIIMCTALISLLIFSAVPGYSASEVEAAKFEKDIMLIVPFNPGAAADAYAQMIKKVGEKYIDHSILLEYKPGGNTSIGTTFMLARPHDGYTICIASNNPEFAIASGQVDTYDEFSIISIGSPVSEQAVLIVPARSPFKTLDDVIDFARKNPGQLNWGAAGTLGYNQFFALQTMRNANVQFNFIPYDNAGEVVIAILGNNVDVGGLNSSNALPYYESGEVRVIAQGLQKRHMPTLPDVPTVYETPGLEYEKYGTPYLTTRAIIIPADVPETMLKTWDNFLQQIITDPEWKAWVEERHVLPEEYMDGKTSTEFMRNSTKIIREVFKDLGNK